MKRVYTLSSCDTSRRIIKQLQLVQKGFDVIDIKKHPLTEVDLSLMRGLSTGYESLFSRRSRQYSAMGLKDHALSEQDYKELILSDYTFLKRPVIIVDKHIFIGNSPITVKSAELILMTRF